MRMEGVAIARETPLIRVGVTLFQSMRTGIGALWKDENLKKSGRRPKNRGLNQIE